MMRVLLVTVITLTGVVGVLKGQDQKKDAPATQPAGGLTPRVQLETSRGNIVLELDGAKAPISVQNFLNYVQSGYYDGTIFHRVMPTFMIQGGGYTAQLEEKKQGQRAPIKNEWKNGLKNVRGSIAMARTSDPDSATSQFFINVVDNGMLDQPRDGAAYAVFGKVVEGMDVVDNIRNTETKDDPKLPMGKVVPVDTVVIKSAKIVGAYDAAKIKELAGAGEQAGNQGLNDFLAKLEKETGKKVEKTPSGLMYVVLKEGTGAQPKPTDRVQVHYTGTLLDGTKFDSSVDRGQPYEFSLTGGVIQGWLEGVALMKVGEKRRFVIPPGLAYGKRGRAPKIPPDATLVFDIELLEIK